MTIVAGIESLLSLARSRAPQNAPYAGEVFSAEAWTILASDPEAILVDVRTPEEWTAVGVPDLSDAGKEAALIPWRFTGMGANPKFFENLAAKAHPSAPVFFLCRAGSRSFDAANLAAKAGYEMAFNVTHGYEGDPNENGERCVTNGWKADALPWKQV